MKKTPLHSEHLSAGARMGEFGGWDMPIQYAGIMQEHVQTRKTVSVFDICHMGEFELSGPGAIDDLERLLTCNISTLSVGQVRYGFMLNDDGGTIDDLTCYRMAPDRFMLVVNAGTRAKDADWIQNNLSAETSFCDLSDSMAKIDVQGPESRTVLEDVLGCVLPELGYFRFREFDAGCVSCIISRTGYTGEFGYEIYLPNESVVALWNQLVSHPMAAPAGLGARDTLRLEMGYSLYGHELSEDKSPAATSRGAFINLKKDFIGRDRVAADLDQPAVCLVGLKLNSKRAAREHDKVYSAGREIGAVSSGSLAPSLGVAVAMAFIRPEYAEVGQVLEVEIRGKYFPAEVVSLPFYSDGSARK